MTVQPIGPETTLQRALRALDESQALLDRHNLGLAKLMRAGHYPRAAVAVNCELREKVAQGRRDVIRARDRIRFGLDKAGGEAVGLKLSRAMDIDLRRKDANPSPRILDSRDAAAS